MPENLSDSLTYFTSEPNVSALRRAYDQTNLELEPYFDQCREAYDDRHNIWPGKSQDLRKHGADAFPWEGASDMECHVIEERITKLVAFFMTALRRSNVRAYPTEGTDAARAKTVSSFLKWMVSSGYIPRFMQEMELAANYLLERGILITYVGWQAEDRRIIQRLSLDQIQLNAPEITEMLEQGDDESVIGMLQSAYEGVTQKRAKKALKELKRTGFAELPAVRRTVDAPEVRTLAADGDFLFPSYVTDPQRSPYCFWRTYYTAQQLENKVITEDWNEEFVQTVIDQYKGVNVDSIEVEQEGRRFNFTNKNSTYEADELIEIVHAYQRLIDPEDGSEGIYCTIFHREFQSSTEVDYAKFELMNGYDDYPVIVTRLSNNSKRLYDATSIPAQLKGLQQQVKVERDTRIDRNSITTLPPILHPFNQPPSNFGPGSLIPRRRENDYQYMETPPASSAETSVEMENRMENQANQLTGLADDDISVARRQFLVDKFLKHCSDVINMCFTCFQRFGPDYVYFRVTGAPDPVQFQKGSPDENYDITISFDSLSTDPETQSSKIEQMINLLKLDRGGRVNVDSLLTAAMSNIDPVLADAIMQETETASQEIQNQILDDLSKIFAGIEMPARPNGGQVASQLIQQYAQQPDIAARLQQDQMFAERLNKYASQYTFQEQQMINATEFGQLGTEAARVGDIQTQGAE